MPASDPVIPGPSKDTPTVAPDVPATSVVTVNPTGTEINTTVTTVSSAEPAKVAIVAETLPSAAPSSQQPTEPAAKQTPPMALLAVDIGGTKVKMLAKGQTEPIKVSTGKTFTPARLVEVIRELPTEWEYEAISIGYPGLVGKHGPRSEPGNLGSGWMGFDFQAALGKPVKMINDAVMQALGSYDGGRMLFLGLGTGLGSAFIAGTVVVPLELGRLRYDDKRTLGEVLGRRGLEDLGKGDWRRAVNDAVTMLMHAFLADYVVIGGGNAKNVKDLPPGARLGNNLTAFRGGYRLWGAEDIWVMADPGGESGQPSDQETLRVV
jgi:polyphosphate glucokinase